MSDDTLQGISSTVDEPTSPAEPEILSPDQQELGKILKSFDQNHDPMGGTALGKDGVLRSLTADRVVIDAAALPPRLIKAYLDRLPYFKEMEDELRGVDGTQTPRAQWFDPPRSLLPKPLSEEQKEEAREMMEEHARLVKEGKMKMPEETCDAPVVRSNYNLAIIE